MSFSTIPNAIIKTKNDGQPWRMSAVFLDYQDGAVWVRKPESTGSSWGLWSDTDPTYHEDIVAEWAN